MKQMKIIGIVLSAVVALGGCKKKTETTGTAGSADMGSAAAPAAGTPTATAPAGSAAPAAAAAPSDVDGDSVELKFTGKYEKGDMPSDEFPTFTVTNKSKHKLFFIKSWHYYYDKDGKQLGREYAERSVGSMDPGASKDMALGEAKAKEPAGTAKHEAVFVGGNFDDNIEFKGDVSKLAPDQRPMKGG